MGMSSDMPQFVHMHSMSLSIPFSRLCLQQEALSSMTAEKGMSM